jgi:hypothetical protein
VKVVVTIIGLVLLIGYIGSNIGSDDAAPAATPEVAKSAVDPDAARAVRLSRKGERLATQIARLSDLGVTMAEDGNAAGACAIVDVQVRKVNKLGRIVEQLRPLADAEKMAKLDQNEIDLRSSIGNAVRLCMNMGY